MLQHKFQMHSIPHIEVNIFLDSYQNLLFVQLKWSNKIFFDIEGWLLTTRKSKIERNYINLTSLDLRRFKLYLVKEIFYMFFSDGANTMEFLVSILGKRTGKFEIQVPYHVESSFADSCLHVKANFVVSTIFYYF